SWSCFPQAFARADGADSGERDLVRKEGLEPPCLSALEPKSSASTNSATFASVNYTRIEGPPGRPGSPPRDRYNPENSIPSPTFAGRPLREFSGRLVASSGAPSRACRGDLRLRPGRGRHRRRGRPDRCRAPGRPRPL